MLYGLIIQKTLLRLFICSLPNLPRSGLRTRMDRSPAAQQHREREAPPQSTAPPARRAIRHTSWANSRGLPASCTSTPSACPILVTPHPTFPWAPGTKSIITCQPVPFGRAVASAANFVPSGPAKCVKTRPLHAGSAAKADSTRFSYERTACLGSRHAGSSFSAPIAHALRA